MIETPAAAVAADSFVGEAAFFSIGTNDHTQYSLAVDRGNANIADRFTPLHPGVLRLIARTVEVGDANGVGVTVCGEMASEPLMAFALMGLGVRRLSVAPRALPLVKRLVRGVATSDASSAMDEALRLRTAQDVAIVLERRLRAACGADPFPYDGLPPQ
jgi:phosphotransferase system enzyme I (PtsI)